MYYNIDTFILMYFLNSIKSILNILKYENNMEFIKLYINNYYIIVCFSKFYIINKTFLNFHKK